MQLATSISLLSSSLQSGNLLRGVLKRVGGRSSSLRKKNNEAAKAEALKAHKVKETVVQQTAIQQASLPFHQAIEDQCSVGIKFSLKPRQVAAIAPVAESFGFDLSNQNWKGKFVGACLRNEIPGALEALAKALSAT